MDKTHDNWQAHASVDGLTSLGLRVPQQTQAPADSFLTDAKHTDAWFASLPMANIGESARRIFNALVDCNRMEMSDVMRARATEQFRKPIDYICNNLERRYTQLSFPLSARSRKTASLARELNVELAVAYKIIVERMLGGGKQRFDEKLMVISLHRALFHLGQVLYQSAIVYSPWPPSVWREIHGIYAYAAHNEVHDVPVKDSIHGQGGQSSSIEDLYKSLLIFAVTDPLRLRQRQITSVFQQIGGWAPRARIQLPGGENKNNKGRFNLDLWSDMPPVHNALSPPARNRRVRILEMRGLIRSLREDFEPPANDATAENQDNKKSAYELIRMLISSWSYPSDRRFVRTHLNFELQLEVGLNSVFDAMSQSQRKAPPKTQQPRGRSSGLQTNSSPLVPSWAASMPRDIVLAPLDSELTSDPIPATSPSPFTNNGTAITDHYALDYEVPVEEEPEPQPVHTINESAGGYCIRWPNASVPKVKVGEVIGIQSTSTSQQYGIGIVRWLKQDPARDLEVGLEIISPRCQTATIWTKKTKSNAKNSLRYNCLLLPESNRGAADNHLITTASEMEIGSEIWLERGGENRLIRLVRMVEASGLFTRYSYRYTNLDGEGADNTRQFDDLWSNL